ncbi:MAG: hypothetical protein ACLFWH_04600 [Actinomycetota bacterium]
MNVEAFTLSELELNGEPIELIGHAELTVNVQYVDTDVPGLQAWIVMGVLNGSQAHRFLPADRALTMRAQTSDGLEMSGQVYPQKVEDNGGSTSVELQGSGNLSGYEVKPDK